MFSVGGLSHSTTERINTPFHYARKAPLPPYPYAIYRGMLPKFLSDTSLNYSTPINLEVLVQSI